MSASKMTMESQAQAYALAPWAEAAGRSRLQEIMARTSSPEILSLALGLPDLNLLPTQAMVASAEQVFQQGPKLLQYAPQLARLKTHIVHLMAQRNVKCTEAEVLLTTGAQQAFSLLSHLLVRPRQPIFVEDYTYFGFLQSIKPSLPEVITIGTGPEEGIDVDEIEHKLERGIRPAYIYVITEGHNPLAVSLSAEKRERLLEVARSWQVPIIEDDTYGLLQYEQPLRPALKAHESELVLYVGSFSKILAPGLRVGWLVAPERLIHPLALIKESMDLDMVALPQCLISSYIETGALPGHLDLLRTTYGQRRERMLAALRREKIPGAAWKEPQAGLFIWLQLASHLDAEGLFEHALRQERLAFVPESAFSSENGSRINGARLNYSSPNLEAIDEGIARLARAISTYGR